MIVNANKSRCLIIGCSRTKNTTPESLPAIQRYNGPQFLVLRHYLDLNPDASLSLDIFVLSAKYGLIGGQTAINDYDRQMTNRRATEIQEEVRKKIENDLLPKEYNEIFLSMGKVYLRAIETLEELVDEKTRVIVSTGASGRKLTALKGWLWERDLTSIKPREPASVAPNTNPQTVVLRRRTITLTTTEAINYLQAKADDAHDRAHQVCSWYVSVSGERLSPKWAAQTLFGVPTNEFSSDEARRALRRLGLNCYRL